MRVFPSNICPLVCSEEKKTQNKKNIFGADLNRLSSASLAVLY